MKRKAIQLAGKTLVVSLPSKWVQRLGIQKGDEVNLEEAQRRLVISSEKESGYQKTSVDVTGLDPMIKRTLGALYKAGYDEFDVQFGTLKELEVIQEVVREEFIGFEVVYQGKNTLTVKEVSHVDSGEFNTVLRRMFLVIISIAEDSLKATQKKDKSWIGAIILRDKDTNKLADFCRRILNKSAQIDKARIPPLYFIVEELEKISDLYRDLCKFAVTKDVKMSKDLEVLYNEVNAYLRDFYDIYYNFKLRDIAQFGKKRYQLTERIDKAVGRTPKGELTILFYLRNIMENIFDMNGPIMAARL